MREQKRKRLEAKGWKVGTAGEFLGLAADVEAYVEVRVRLGAFPGNLHGEVENALDRANFLKGVLGQRILTALNESTLLAYLGSLLTSAIRSNA